MIQVECRTNLDLVGEQWPRRLPAVPRVGDRIVSATKWGHFQLELEVVGVTWEHDRAPRIELHMTRWQREILSTSGARQGSIRAFYEWYAPLVGKRVSDFI